jgi:hypothetical protein
VWVRWVCTDSDTLSTRLYIPDAPVCGPAACVVGSSVGFRVTIYFIKCVRSFVLFKVPWVHHALVIYDDVNRWTIGNGFGRFGHRPQVCPSFFHLGLNTN